MFHAQYGAFGAARMGGHKAPTKAELDKAVKRFRFLRDENRKLASVALRDPKQARLVLRKLARLRTEFRKAAQKARSKKRQEGLLKRATACQTVIRYWVAQIKAHNKALRLKARKQPNLIPAVRVFDAAVASVTPLEFADPGPLEAGETPVDALVAQEAVVCDTELGESEEIEMAEEDTFAGVPLRHLAFAGALGGLAGLLL